MKDQLKLFLNEVDLIDKILFCFIILIPLSLAISIFFADLLASLSTLILIYIYLTQKNILFFNSIKKEIFFFLSFFIIILTSLIISDYKNQSFLPSFFYFRYFFLSLSIFYILKKYSFINHLFFNFILLSIGIVVFDSLFQYLFGFNFFGYEKVNFNKPGEMSYLTGFFDDEKKLGSYLVRFLPLLISLFYFNKPKIPIKLELIIIFLIGVIIFLASERTALFLLIVIYFFYFLVSNKKIVFFIFSFVIFTALIYTETHLTEKYFIFTMKQIGLQKALNQHEKKKFKTEDLIRYYSVEHENLSYTGIQIFKKNILFGSGVKTFFQECHNLKKQKIIKSNKRKNVMLCSTHPHNTYIQILSEIGILGFLLVIFLFIKVLKNNFVIILNKVKNNIDRSFYFINLAIIINLMPLIPSGSFFNNWISLVMFFSLGFWLYVQDKFKS